MPTPTKPTAQTAPTAAVTTPERWHLDGGDATSATLVIPADARRQRRFEIACAVTVNVPVNVPATATATAPATASAPWLQMSVLAGGVQQWRRRAPAHNPGAWDGLDYRFAHSVPVGQALRITVVVAVQGVRRRSVVIEADEV